MIFAPALAEKVMAGEKTVTRRLVRQGGVVYTKGRTYAVQTGRGKKAIGRIRVLDVQMEALGDALYEAKEEGFRDAAAFRRFWTDCYGRWNPNLAVWRIEFEVVER